MNTETVFLKGADFGFAGADAGREVFYDEVFRLETVEEVAGGLKGVLRNIFLATMLAVACPGDDVMAISASAAIPVASAVEMPVEPDQLVGVLWAHRKLLETVEVLEGDLAFKVNL